METRSWKELGRRFALDMSLIIVMFALSFLLPDTEEEAKRASAQMNIMARYVVVTSRILWGWMIFDLGRMIKYPYIDMSALIEKYPWGGIVFITVLMGVIIHAFAFGG